MLLPVSLDRYQKRSKVRTVRSGPTEESINQESVVYLKSTDLASHIYDRLPGLPKSLSTALEPLQFFIYREIGVTKKAAIILTSRLRYKEQFVVLYLR
jgi:hypothetical protein